MPGYKIVLRKNGAKRGELTGYATKSSAVAEAQTLADSAGGGVKVYVEPVKAKANRKAPRRRNTQLKRDQKVKLSDSALSRRYSGDRAKGKQWRGTIFEVVGPPGSGAGEWGAEMWSANGEKGYIVVNQTDPHGRWYALGDVVAASTATKKAPRRKKNSDRELVAFPGIRRPSDYPGGKNSYDEDFFQGYRAGEKALARKRKTPLSGVDAERYFRRYGHGHGSWWINGFRAAIAVDRGEYATKDYKIAVKVGLVHPPGRFNPKRKNRKTKHRPGSAKTPAGFLSTEGQKLVVRSNITGNILPKSWTGFAFSLDGDSVMKIGRSGGERSYEVAKRIRRSNTRKNPTTAEVAKLAKWQNLTGLSKSKIDKLAQEAYRMGDVGHMSTLQLGKHFSRFLPAKSKSTHTNLRGWGDFLFELGWLELPHLPRKNQGYDQTKKVLQQASKLIDQGKFKQADSLIRGSGGSRADLSNILGSSRMKKMATWASGTTRRKNYSTGDAWLQEADTEMEEEGTVGAFTKQARRAGYKDTMAFARAVMKGWRSGKKKVYNKKTRKQQGITQKTMYRANFAINAQKRRNPHGAPQRMTMDLGEFRWIAGPYSTVGKANKAKEASHHRSWGARYPKTYTRVRKEGGAYHVYSYDPEVASRYNPAWGEMAGAVGKGLGKAGKAAWKGAKRGAQYGYEYGKEGAARGKETAQAAVIAANLKDFQRCAKKLHITPGELQQLEPYVDAIDKAQAHIESTQERRSSRGAQRQTALAKKWNGKRRNSTPGKRGWHPVLFGSNLIISGVGRDTNGNKVIKVSYPNSRAWSIQTLGTPMHGLLRGVTARYEILPDISSAIEPMLIDHIRKYGSAKQKKGLRVYSGG